MRKIKIFLTVLILYEFVILTILQIPHYCFNFFDVYFCSISFRYVLMCIIVPSLIALFVWWMPDISRMFCKKCQCDVQTDKPLKDMVKEIISKQDIERLITAAVIMGVQKFAANHPKTKETFDDILDIITKTNAGKTKNLTK